MPRKGRVTLLREATGRAHAIATKLTTEDSKEIFTPSKTLRDVFESRRSSVASREIFLKEVNDYIQKQKHSSNPFLNNDLIKQHLRKTDIDNLKAIFDIFDESSHGTLSVSNLHEALNFLDIKVDQEQINKFLSNNSVTNQFKYEFKIFLCLVIEFQHHSYDKIGEISQGFKSFDIRKRGKFDLEDMKKLNKKYSIGLTNQELEDMISLADTDGDGCINYDEFEKVMCKTDIFS